MSNYFASLEDELVAAVAREAQPNRFRRALAKPRSRIVVGVGLLLAIGGTPAAALLIDRRPQPDGLVRFGERRDLASGVTPDGRHWQVVGGGSRSGFCLGIRLPVQPDLPDTFTSEGCGGPAPGSLSVAIVSGGSFRQHAIVFGTAPKDAEKVVIDAVGTKTEIASIAATGDFAGRLYVAQIPPTDQVASATVTAYDSDGRHLAQTTFGDG